MERDPRAVVLQQAANDMRLQVLEIVQHYDLTPTETVQVLLDSVRAYNDYALRDERTKKH